MSVFQIFEDSKGKFRFRLRSSNGEIILKSQGYKSKSSAKKGIESVISNYEDEKNYVRKGGDEKKYYFVLKAANGEIIGTSERYVSNAGMEFGIKAVIRNVKEAAIVSV